MPVSPLTVMSFNIRYGTAQDAGHTWADRRAAVIDRIRSLSPDLLGLQECRTDGQLQDLLAGLPEYSWFGEPRGGDSDSALEMAPVFYRKDRFSEAERGVRWLSETPDAPGSLSWDAALPRTLTWVVLEAAGAKYWFGNTHFDHWSWEARVKSAELVAQVIARRPAGETCILTGDFNASKDTEPYRILTAHLPDPFRSPDLPSRPAEGSFHDFGRLMPAEPIDWILAAAILAPTHCRVDDRKNGELWLSDHHPVVVEFKGSARPDHRPLPAPAQN